MLGENAESSKGKKNLRNEDTKHCSNKIWDTKKLA